MRVYQRDENDDLKYIQSVELDFLPDNPCNALYFTELMLAISPKGDLLVAGAPVLKTAIDNNPTVKVHSKVVRIPLAQLGDSYFGGGSGRTANPIVEPVLMDVTGKVNGSTTAVEVDYDGSDWLFVTSWRAVGLTRCKL